MTASPGTYDDGGVRLDDTGVHVRRYYFPWAGSKHIPYGNICGFEARPMTWFRGNGRIWGTGSWRYWLPLDIGRPRKNTLVVLDLGRRVKPAFSPDDPDRVIGMLRERTAET